MTEQNEQTTITPSNPTTTPTTIVAGAGSYYRTTRYIMAIACIGMGLWFGYDGFYNWPQGNVKYEQYLGMKDAKKHELEATNDPAARERLAEEFRKLDEESRQYSKHTDMDLNIQKALCFLLPPLGIFVVALALYKSRGRYTLSGTTLSVPGHPGISLDSITHIDKRLWERKGIAYLDYESNGKTDTIVLDDFLYDRDPTDEIFKQIEDYLRSTSQKNVPIPRAPR